MSEELRYNEPWILQRADPYVYRHTDGNYYFTASVPAYDRIVLRKSKTLAGLKDAEEVTVWEKHKEGIMSEHIWAPELHYLDGKWYIYFAGGDKDDIWAIRPYVLECADADPLTGAWTEKGKMGRTDEDEFSFEAFSLDATVFENKGKHYYVWAEKVGVGKQISNLYIGEMETPYKLKTVQVLLTTPDYDWERVGFWVNEGPAVIHHDGKIYLTYSASETGIAYCMGMLTACGGNKTEVVPIEDTEEAEREVPYAMYINRVEGGKASVTISNYTDEEILYGTDFHLQKYIGSDWVDVSTLVPNYRFNEGVYSIPAHSSVVTDVKWEWLYSTLTDGEYMLTKTVLDPKEDGTYDQATMYVTFVFGTP